MKRISAYNSKLNQSKEPKSSHSLQKKLRKSSVISKKLSPKIIDSQIKTNFYESSIYKSQVEKKKVLTKETEYTRKKSIKNTGLNSLYSKLIFQD
jgi:hypothetical protein